MKDAKGHGSEAHMAGIKSVGKPFISVQRLKDKDGNPTTEAMGRKWYAHQDSTGKKVGDLAFKSRNEGAAFITEHLDPHNANWQHPLGKGMEATYRAARAKLYNIR